MPGPLARELRMPQVERLLMEGKTQLQIAAAVGVSPKTVERWLAKRKDKITKNLSARQAVVFDFLVKASLDDFQALGQMIDQLDPSMVVTDAYGKRTQIARNLARFFGIESTIRVQNIQNNLQLNDNRKQVSLNGPVQIIVEANGGQFDSQHGAGQVRMDSPSADEISSAQG